MLIKKITSFIFGELKRDPLYLFKYLVLLVSPWNRINRVAFQKESETIKILSGGKSFIRIGDGEIGLLHGRDIFYQKYSKNLEDGIRSFILEYNEDSPYILAIPKYVNYSKKELRKARGGLKCWLSLIITYFDIFPKKTSYANAHIFYHENLLKEFFLKITSSDKKIIFVTNITTITGLKENITYGDKVVYIETPKEDTFKELDKIESLINKEISALGNCLLILSCGPAGKILAHKYSKLNIPSYDIGFGLKYFYDKTNYAVDLPELEK